MSTDNPRTTIRFGEFVALMATLMALAALSIDMVIPALPVIVGDLGVGRDNDRQLIISVLFLGFAIGQLVYGPLSESTGRKPAVYAGLGLFIGGCVLSLFATTFPMMLVGRFFQGAGVAAPRTMTIALVRDKFEGRSMARVMSFIMAVFILFPVIAPALGQAILAVSGWRTIFGVYLTMALFSCTWFGLRQEETLASGHRIPFTARRIIGGFGIVLSNRRTLGFTIAAGLVFGGFIGYLNSVQQIFAEQYALGERFVWYFAVLAVALGCASLTNASLVMRHGMHRLSAWSLKTLAGLSVLFLAIAFVLSGHPPLWTLMAYLMGSFFCIGLLFSNMNSMAMEPLGHIAGTGAAVVGALSTSTSLVLGTIIGQAYNDTVLPLVAGFAILSFLSMGAMRWAEAGAPGTSTAPVR